ncbi:FadR/GntR family transcriptional regulator [Leifsonia poae]|uniref:FadR/GntR family transcriptional regulator n=1 Tax=Leifsonia poae TaxID=110933 RepID=UPI003D6692E8
MSGGARRRAFARVLDSVGTAIVAGDLPEGHVDTVDGLIARTGASRTIVREATRVLVSLGMLTASPRVGLRVTPSSEWDTLDVDVVRWRLASSGREEQLRDLLQLRLAIEPEAARIAAGGASHPEADELAAAGERMVAAADARDEEAFLEADRRIHGLILSMSANAMFARLQSVVEEALRVRAPHEPVAWASAPADVELHLALITAIRAGDASGAAEAMSSIVRGSSR